MNFLRRYFNFNQAETKLTKSKRGLVAIDLRYSPSRCFLIVILFFERSSFPKRGYLKTEDF